MIGAVFVKKKSQSHLCSFAIETCLKQHKVYNRETCLPVELESSTFLHRFNFCSFPVVVIKQQNRQSTVF